MTPAVSIVLPARNAAHTLPACLRSIGRQTFTSWECLVIDDGSTDATARMASEAARSDDRFRIISTPPRGIVSALNEGRRTARAPLIARMDADDVMHRDRMAFQVRALEAEESLSAVGCHVRIFPRAAMSPRLREYEEWLNGLRTADEIRRDAFVECPVAHPSLLMRREMAALGYRECAWPEDYDLILRALGDGMRIGAVPRRLLSWRDRPDRLSRRDPRYSLAQFTACKAHYLASGFLRGHDEYVLWGYGGTGRALRRALAAHGRTPVRIVEVKRTRLGQRIYGALVIPPEALRETPRLPIVVSVARPQPRAEIRGALASMGFVEGRDFVCAA
jgi:glycosyltransferase involved in cell wall biosynthesis